MKYKLILMFVLSFIAHITIAGTLVYVPYHLYRTVRTDSTENIIWGQIQGAGSSGQRSAVRNQKLESRDRPSGLSGEKQGEQEKSPYHNPLPHVEEQHEGMSIIPPARIGEMAGGEMAENLPAENTGTGTDIGNGTGDDEKGRVYGIQLKALIEQVKKEIEKNRYYPFLARLKGLEGTVYINFHIGQDGKPGSIAVTRSSGSNVLDAAAVKTIMNLKPFKNINPELRELDINVPITYKLRE